MTGSVHWYGDVFRCKGGHVLTRALCLVVEGDRAKVMPKNYGRGRLRKKV